MESARSFIFLGAIALLAFAVVALVLFRANPPVETNSNVQPKREFTFGNFIQGSQLVPKGELLAFKFELNRKTTLRGNFSTPRNDVRINCLIITAEDLAALKEQREVKPLIETGIVPKGEITRQFGPGEYYVVFDNRNGEKDLPLTDVYFSVN